MFFVTISFLAAINGWGQVGETVDTIFKKLDSTVTIATITDSCKSEKTNINILPVVDTSVNFFDITRLADSAEYYSLQGDSAYNVNKYVVAEKAYLQSLKMDAKNIAVYKKLGDCYINMKRYGNAILQYKAIIDIDANDTLALCKLSELCYMQQSWAETITYTLQCIDKKIGTRNNLKLAKAYLQQEEYSTAAKYLQAASIEEPTNADVPYMMGTIWVEMNDMEKAFQAYNISLQLDSTNADRHYEIAMYHYQMNAASKVVYHLEKALKYGIRNDNDTKSILGLSYIATGNFKKGEELAQEVLAKKQMDKKFMNDVGYAYYGVRRYDDAIRWWDQILAIDRNNSKALYMIGMAFRKKGDEEKGNRLCDAAIALDPSLAGFRKQMMPPQGMGL